MNAEQQRLAEACQKAAPWKKWGPYLSERQWGTVREDYSDNGDAWNYFSHDQARSRAYRWGEDGLGGICDDHQVLCFALALWNGRDPILKERLFGLTNSEGNHGEDVKEYYFYLDSTPTHSYMKYLYKYPQAAYPYVDLGLDNIGVFDRSSQLPTGGSLEQADGTAWMVFYSQQMLRIAVELALHDRLYEEFVCKFFQHTVWLPAAGERESDSGASPQPRGRAAGHPAGGRRGGGHPALICRLRRCVGLSGALMGKAADEHVDGGG